MMESLVLDDDDNNNNNRGRGSGNGSNNNPSSRSNGDTNGDGSHHHHHPLSPSSPFAEISPTDDDDPLLSSPSHRQNHNSFNSFLEPPSYADAVFRSFDGDRGKQINGHGGVSTSSPSSRPKGGANGDGVAEISTTDDDYPLLSSPSRHRNPNSFNSFLEPPSYADAVFGSFDGDRGKQINGHGVSTSSPSSSSDYLKISVTDPQKQQDLTNSLVPGGNTFVTYLITTWTNLPEFAGTEFTVRRRFKDVVTLSDRLSDSYRGYFIPLRPDKNVVENQVMQKQEFVEHRRMALEKYLRKLAAHTVIRRSEELRVFLQVQGKLPLLKTTDVTSRMIDGAVKLPKQLFGESVVSAAVDPDDVAQPAKGGRDLLRLFKELRQSVSNHWGGARSPVVEEDEEFLEKKKKLQEFEQELSNVSQQAEFLVKAQQDIGETLGQLGLAFVKLTKFESEEAKFNSQKVRAADMKNVATSAVKASRLYRELNAQTVRHLDKLHEYLGVMLTVNNAYSDRSNALLTIQTLLSELSNLNFRIEKLEAAASKTIGGDRSRVRKIEELKETTRVTEEAKNRAVREYERIKENNKNELERLDKEKHEDFFDMLKGFVTGYAEKMASVWQTVANETSGYAKSS